jgi:hypothetical protein
MKKTTDKDHHEIKKTWDIFHHEVKKQICQVAKGSSHENR